jgi:hypothetical protein
VKWLAIGSGAWTAIVAAIAFLTYSPRTCSPIDHDCLDARSSEAWFHAAGAASVWVIGLLFGIYLWLAARRAQADALPRA